MMIGAEKTQTSIWRDDTAELYAYFYDTADVPLAQAAFTSVSFTVRQPAGVDVVAAGSINADGSCYHQYTVTNDIGLYKWTAQATLTTGEKRTYRDEFWVADPLEDPPSTQSDEIADEVWMRLEDCFDSEGGGPWLRDMSLVYFEPRKVERFIAEGILRINVSPPMTNLTLADFTMPVTNSDPSVPAGTMMADPDQIILVQATLIAVIRHLMRSYTEQPMPEGANVVWHNRRDYLQRWGEILQIEEENFRQMIALWKRQFYNFGQGKLLTMSKAGRLYPTGWRARNSARGFT